MTIKFRGRGLKDKKLYYGSYVHTMPQSSFPAIIDNDGFYIEVDPESIAQLVGYDSDDNEIYEDDELIDRAGHEWTAVLLPQAEMDCGGVYEGLYGKEKFKLKGRGENENLS